MNDSRRPAKSTNSVTNKRGLPSPAEPHQKFVDSQQLYISAYIQLADTKAAWAFAISSALAAFILTNREHSPLLKQPSDLIIASVTLISLALSVASAIFAFIGIAPKLFSSRSTNLFFFGTAANLENARDFYLQISDQDEQSLLETRIYHNFDIAKICAKKYKRVKQAFWLGFMAVGLLGIALAMGSIGGQRSGGAAKKGAIAPIPASR
ncbi:hypothetical protein XCY_002615 [Xanthomonas arboricola pv. juglandis]|uniref:Pycsar system effector family protein n=1 Tax=Xanthomonas arboricola TaxID=56448 RepID=UPI001AF33B6C|nr:Pycsar system effector family protein [Xanthomonas arboricola]CAG2092129.1 hypothetical protein XCY_002615 [Xanthomonas arboricola pv. juglandis]